MSDVEKAAELINASQRPLVLLGQGVTISGAEAEFKAFVEKAGLPVASTLHGLSSFPTTHSLYTGMLGMHGNYAPNVNTNQCDLLIGIGMRFDDRVTGNLETYAKQAKIIHIEIDPSEIDKNVKTDVAINADAKQALELLISKIENNTHEKWLETFSELNEIEYEKVISKDIHPEGDKMHMGEVVNALSEVTDGRGDHHY